MSIATTLSRRTEVTGHVNVSSKLAAAMKSKLALATAISLFAFPTAALAGPAHSHTSVTYSHATRVVAHASSGNVSKVAWYWWGVRIWLNHDAAQAAWKSVAAAGSFAKLANIPVIEAVPGLGWAVQYIGCTGQFVKEVRRDDVGRGVVLDVDYIAPWWSCGTMTVQSQ